MILLPYWMFLFFITRAAHLLVSSVGYGSLCGFPLFRCFIFFFCVPSPAELLGFSSPSALFRVSSSTLRGHVVHYSLLHKPSFASWYLETDAKSWLLQYHILDNKYYTLAGVPPPPLDGRLTTSPLICRSPSHLARTSILCPLPSTTASPVTLPNVFLSPRSFGLLRLCVYVRRRCLQLFSC